ncbi:MAG: hypothetical protein EHM42_10600 [Planctomycetaceae bacterium]|nr:MAG: hypothetical protein EHM42_10600 [Planctomycetaceae bacterium]
MRRALGFIAWTCVLATTLWCAAPAAASDELGPSPRRATRDASTKTRRPVADGDSAGDQSPTGARTPNAKELLAQARR